MKVLSNTFIPTVRRVGEHGGFAVGGKILVGEILGNVILPLLRDTHCYACLIKFG